jgi:hypothetical protein
MEIFFIFFGAIKLSNAIYIYGPIEKERFNLIVISFWGLTFILVGVVELMGVSGIIKSLVYLFFGISWLPMMWSPCTDKILRINKTTLLIRKIIFLIIGGAAIGLKVL